MIARILHAGGRNARHASQVSGMPGEIRTTERLARRMNLSVETYINSATYDTCHFNHARRQGIATVLPENYLQTSPHHGTGGGDHGAPDPQQNGGALKQNTRAQARGMQTNRRE